MVCFFSLLNETSTNNITVEEFYPPEAPKGWLDLFKSKPKEPEPVDRYELPPIPADWKPHSISIAKKAQLLTEKALAEPTMPKLLEYYHEPAVVDAIRLREWEAKRAERRELIENQADKRWDKLTAKEIENHATLLKNAGCDDEGRDRDS